MYYPYVVNTTSIVITKRITVNSRENHSRGGI
jgi:hypothetical protein